MTANFNTVTADIIGRTGYPTEIIGNDSNAKVGFFGATPVGQQVATAAVSTAAIAAVVTTAVSTASGVYGFITAAQALDLATKINLLITQVASLTTAVNANSTNATTFGLTA